MYNIYRNQRYPMNTEYITNVSSLVNALNHLTGDLIRRHPDWSTRYFDGQIDRSVGLTGPRVCKRDLSTLFVLDLLCVYFWFTVHPLQYAKEILWMQESDDHESLHQNFEIRCPCIGISKLRARVILPYS